MSIYGDIQYFLDFIVMSSMIVVSVVLLGYAWSYGPNVRPTNTQCVFVLVLLCVLMMAGMSYQISAFDYSPAYKIIARSMVAFIGVFLCVYIVYKTPQLLRNMSEHEGLVQRARRYDSIFNRIPAGIAIVNRDGWIYDCNEQFANIIGRGTQETRTMTFAEFTYAPDLEKDMNHFRDMLNGVISEYSIEKRYVRPSGELVWGYLTVQWYDGARQMFLSTVVDITDRKVLEIRREETARLLNIGYWEHYLKEEDSYWSSGFREIYEYDSMVLPSNALIESSFHPDDTDRVFAQYTDFISDPNPLREYKLEYRIMTPNKGVRHVKSVAVKIATSNQRNADAVLGGVMDITDHRQREEALKRSNEELEQFAYAASHDLQEPIRQVSNYVQLLIKRDPSIRDRYPVIVDTILEGTNKMHQLVEDLLQFSRSLSTETIGVSSFGKVLEEVLRTHRGIIEDTHSEVIADGDLPGLLSISTIALSSIITNLLTNAIKFKKKDEDLVLRISSKPHPGGWVISFKDNGKGIKREHWETIFDIFNRLDRDTAGTGMGLALCKRYTTQSGGDIYVGSSGPGGTCMDVFLLEASGEKNNGTESDAS